MSFDGLRAIAFESRRATRLATMVAAHSLSRPYKSPQEIGVRNPDAPRLPHGAVIALAVIAFVSIAPSYFA